MSHLPEKNMKQISRLNLHFQQYLSHFFPPITDKPLLFVSGYSL